MKIFTTSIQYISSVVGMLNIILFYILHIIISCFITSVYGGGQHLLRQLPSSGLLTVAIFECHIIAGVHGSNYPPRLLLSPAPTTVAISVGCTFTGLDDHSAQFRRPCHPQSTWQPWCLSTVVIIGIPSSHCSVRSHYPLQSHALMAVAILVAVTVSGRGVASPLCAAFLISNIPLSILL